MRFESFSVEFCSLGGTPHRWVLGLCELETQKLFKDKMPKRGGLAPKASMVTCVAPLIEKGETNTSCNYGSIVKIKEKTFVFI